MMGKKERVLNAINKVRQDILPTQIDYTPEMKKRIRGLLKISETLVDKELGNHIRYFSFDDKAVVDKVNGIQYDIWGVGWDTILTEGFHVRYHPLFESDNLSKYKFPEPEDKLLSGLRKIESEVRKDYFILFDQGWTLFERSWLLRGYENTLTDFYSREKEINYLLDGITDFQVEMAKKIISTGAVDGVYTGDDFGTQRDLMISPETWRKFFKKRYKKIWEIYKKNNLYVFHHSCGNIFAIIPDLIEIGLDVLSPIQPEAMNLGLLSEKFGKYLTFFGGISTQKTLPFGTSYDVRNEIIDRIKVLGRNCGYIISPSHEITSDCKPENFLTLLHTFRDYKEGKISNIIN
jgi:uroporphyrinogen decarboxylase